jgi:hypothetical protein
MPGSCFGDFTDCASHMSQISVSSGCISVTNSFFFDMCGGDFSRAVQHRVRRCRQCSRSSGLFLTPAEGRTAGGARALCCRRQLRPFPGLDCKWDAPCFRDGGRPLRRQEVMDGDDVDSRRVGTGVPETGCHCLPRTRLAVGSGRQARQAAIRIALRGAARQSYRGPR